MTSKKASKKTATKTAKTTQPRKNSPIPFAKIAKLHADGKSVIQIAKAINRYNEGSPDATKSVRAILSNMYRGYKDANGKTVKLRKRERGTVAKVVKTVAKLATKPSRKAKKEAVPDLASV
jgi:hypothetical protein